MGIINAECGKTVSIGYQGENKRQRVRIPRTGGQVIPTLFRR